jgi:hypothetical protein
MNKLFIAGLLALTATTTAISSAEARPGDSRYERRYERRDDRREDRREAYADRVERALERDGQLRRFDLDSDDRGRSIEIRGRVNTRYQRDRALSIARRTAPGFNIINRIVVR